MKSKNNTIYENYEFIKEVAGEYLKSLFSIYQIGLATSMKGSDFTFDSVQLLHHQCHKMNVKYDGSYIDSPDQVNRKKKTINPKNKDDKCFQFATTVALNYRETKLNPERVLNSVLFINKYIWNGIKYSSKKEDWKKFESNNPTIAVNVLYKKEL